MLRLVPGGLCGSHVVEAGCRLSVRDWPSGLLRDQLGSWRVQCFCVCCQHATRGLSIRTHPVGLPWAIILGHPANRTSPFSGAQFPPTGRTANPRRAGRDEYTCAFTAARQPGFEEVTASGLPYILCGGPFWGASSGTLPLVCTGQLGRSKWRRDMAGNLILPTRRQARPLGFFLRAP